MDLREINFGVEIETVKRMRERVAQIICKQEALILTALGLLQGCRFTWPKA
jgi:hypothetical protein